MRKVNQETYARLFKELLNNPITPHEAAEVSGIHIITAQSLMRCLKKHKVVHISAWEQDRLGRDVTPVYSLGSKRNVPRRKTSSAQRQAVCRAKKKGLELINMITRQI